MIVINITKYALTKSVSNANMVVFYENLRK